MAYWRRLGLIALLLALSALRVQAGDNWELHPEWADDFKAQSVSGTMLIYDEQAQRYLVLDRQRAETAFAPASTFKIFNALTALETGVIADEHEVLKWDGTKRWLAVWNRDHDLASGMKYSVVWFYQEIARRVGQERMQAWIDKAGYGNRDISGGIDRFWLGKGGLRISAVEQIGFLRRLADDALPFSARSQDIVRRITIVEQGDGYVLHAKTGWKQVEGETDLGWYVGWVERDARRWFFALNIDMPAATDAPRRAVLAKAVLTRVGALPAAK
jgi:beta-lactamase class D